jgi:hypothetical protein
MINQQVLPKNCYWQKKKRKKKKKEKVGASPKNAEIGRR